MTPVTARALALASAAAVVGLVVLTVCAAEALAERRRRSRPWCHALEEPPPPVAHPGRPVDGNSLTPDEDDLLAVAQFMLTRYPLAREPERPTWKGRS